MRYRDWLTRRNTIIGSAILMVGLFVVGFLALRRAPRVPMERYVPASALAFLEIDSLADVADGLTNTRSWQELAPLLGLSSQFRQIGFLADLIGRTGFGPDEAVLVGRAQYALVVTGIESKGGETEEGSYLHLRPDFTLIIESHLAPKAAARIVRERASIIAGRIYGESVASESEDYYDSQLLVFHAAEPGHRLLASSVGSVILIANDEAAMKSCIDSVAGRAATLAEDATLKQMRPEVDQGAAVFAYVSASGIHKLFEIWPALLADRSATPEAITSFTDLLQHISQQSAKGLLYASEFDAVGVTEKYLTVLRPEVGAALAEPLKSTSGTGFQLLGLIPGSVERVTLLEVKRPGELPERLLRQLSPNLDIVAGVALREFVINLRKQYGLESSDSLGDAVGDELALVDFGDGGPPAMLLPAPDKTRLASAVLKYLQQKGATVTNEAAGGVEITISSNEDRRAAAFVGGSLVLGTRDQITRVIETQSKHEGIGEDERFKRILASCPTGASLISYRPQVEDAGPLLLAISKLTRVTDGSLELLERGSARNAIDGLPRSASFTEFRDYGVYTESRSAVGNFSLISALVKSDE